MHRQTWQVRFLLLWVIASFFFSQAAAAKSSAKPPGERLKVAMKAFHKHLERQGIFYTYKASREKVYFVPEDSIPRAHINVYNRYSGGSIVDWHIFGIKEVYFWENNVSGKVIKKQEILKYSVNIGEAKSVKIGAVPAVENSQDESVFSYYKNYVVMLEFDLPVDIKALDPEAEGSDRMKLDKVVTFGFAKEEDARKAKNLLDEIVNLSRLIYEQAQYLARLRDMSQLSFCTNGFRVLGAEYNLTKTMWKSVAGQYQSDYADMMAKAFDIYAKRFKLPMAVPAADVVAMWKLAIEGVDDVQDAMIKLGEGRAEGLSDQVLKDVLAAVQVHVNAEATGVYQHPKRTEGLQPVFSQRFVHSPGLRSNPEMWPSGFCGLVYTEVFPE